jgi:hypothetical protein
MEDTALNTIQNGLDLAFAELDAAVMDENIDRLLSGQDVQITVSPVLIADKKPMKSLVAPSDLDFDSDSEVSIVDNRQKITVS